MNRVRRCMQEGVDEAVFPGAVLLVAERGETLFLEAFGYACLRPTRKAMTEETVFDLASLTKPLATTLSIMVLVEAGKIRPDQPLGDLIADFSPTEKRNVTLRRLLSHTSGLPAYQPYYEMFRDLDPGRVKATLHEYLLREPLVHPPGTACLYSDLGFIILQWVIETTTGLRLDDFTSRAVYGPLGMDGLFFNPLPWHEDTSYAATEDCPWRGKVLEGEVHDDNAYTMGGVAGHAGLFGTAQSVYGLLLQLLNVYHGLPGNDLFRPDTVRTFFKRQTPTESWALGFDTPSRPDSSSGAYFSDRSVGHLGFTGTSFWMDLDRRIIVVLLTNRIHPDRNNNRIKAFRPRLHDTVMKSLGK